MKHKLFLLFLLSTIITYSQNSVYSKISPHYLTQMSKSCEGEIHYLRFEYGGVNEFDSYGITVDPYTCAIRSEKDVPNGSFTWEGDGLEIVEKGREANTGYYYAKVRFTASGKYRVKWEHEEQVIGWDEYICGREPRPSSTTKYYYSSESYNEVIFIPKPPKLIISSDKPILINGQEGVLNTTHCPNTIQEQGLVVPFPTSKNTFWYYDCAEPLYINRDGPQINLTRNTNIPNNFYGLGTFSFKVKCIDNGCSGDLSDSFPISIHQSPPETCEPTTINEINSITDVGRKDYHLYSTETRVCKIGGDNPNCTKAKVYEKLLESKYNNAFTPGDLLRLPIKPEKNSGFGITRLFDPDLNNPVQNCEQVNLFGGLGGFFGLAVMAAIKQFPVKLPIYIPSEIFPCLRSMSANAKGFSSPIIQHADPYSYTVTNYTLPGHILYPGKVVRGVVEDCEYIKIVTIGTGNHCFGDSPSGQFMSWFNKLFGTLIFDEVDERFIVNFNADSK